MRDYGSMEMLELEWESRAADRLRKELQKTKARMADLRKAHRAEVKALKKEIERLQKEAGT